MSLSESLNDLGKPLVLIAAMGALGCTDPALQQIPSITANGVDHKEPLTCLALPYIAFGDKESLVDRTYYPAESTQGKQSKLRASINEKISLALSSIGEQYGMDYARETIAYCFGRSYNQSSMINPESCPATGVTFKENMPLFSSLQQSELLAPALPFPYNYLLSGKSQYYDNTHQRLRVMRDRNQMEWVPNKKNAETSGCDANVVACLDERVQSPTAPIRLDLRDDKVIQMRTGLRVIPYPIYGVSENGKEWCVWREGEFPPLATRDGLQLSLNNLHAEYGTKIASEIINSCSQRSRNLTPPIGTPFEFFVQPGNPQSSSFWNFPVLPKNEGHFLFHKPSDRAAAVNAFAGCLDTERLRMNFHESDVH